MANIASFPRHTRRAALDKRQTLVLRNAQGTVIAVERGCGRLEWAVLNWNEPSIKFYESLGAKKQDEWSVFRLTGETLQALAR